MCTCSIIKGTLNRGFFLAIAPFAVGKTVYNTGKTALGIIGTGLNAATFDRVSFFREVSKWSKSSKEILSTLFKIPASIIQPSLFEIQGRHYGYFSSCFEVKVRGEINSRICQIKEKRKSETFCLKDRAVIAAEIIGYELALTVSRTTDLAIGILSAPVSLLVSLADVLTLEKIIALHRVNRKIHQFTVSQLYATILIYDYCQGINAAVSILTK